MAKKEQLRRVRTGTVINLSAKKQETTLGRALRRTEAIIRGKFPSVQLIHESQWFLKDIIVKLRTLYPDIDFCYYFETSNMKPDGGILSILDKEENKYPILIAEVKNQGTNVLRIQEGLEPQARGNAIERLGKNVIGFRTALINEGIFPFVCFGEGCDFAEDSSILDRVVTIAMFGKLNKTYLVNEGPVGEFKRGSFYFREQPWSEDEMVSVMSDIATRSIYYYFSRYGEQRFNVNETPDTEMPP
ncbi:MAG: hypothetical protein HPY54_06670 [Chthonomonadetes bacterium]|nr:hypothetical protein [Chthonomonadetes bacterium]